MQQMYHCGRCGSPVAQGTAFCQNCGNKLDWSAQQAPPPPDQQQAWGQQQPPPPPGYPPPGPQPFDQQQAWGQQQQPPGTQPPGTQPPGTQPPGSQPPYQQPPPGWGPPPPYGQPPGWAGPPQYPQYGYPGQATPKKGLSWPIIALIAVTAILLIAGGIGIYTKGDFFMNRSDTPPAGAEPVISSFRADPPGINTGGSTTLKWTVTGADSVSINQGIGDVDPSGTKSVSPADTTTYTLTATNSVGSATKIAKVTVAAEGAPQIVVFNADPDDIAPGQSSTLEWNVAGATTVTIDHGVGPVDATGTTEVSPTSLTTYTMTATNDLGTVTASVTVIVSGEGYPVISFFTADPGNITEGQDSTLEWDVKDATSVTINNGIDEVSASGTEEVSPTISTTYTLTATNSQGSVTKTVTVNVSTSDVPLIVLFTAEPSDIGGFFNLFWIVTGASSVTIEPEVGVVGSDGQRLIVPTETTDYTLTAVNDNGTITKTITVTVE